MDQPDSPESEGMLGRFGVPPDAERLWRLLLKTPSVDFDDVTQHTGLLRSAVKPAIEALIAARLVQKSSTPIGIAALDPTIAVASHIGRAERQLFDQFESLWAMRADLPGLIDEFARGRSSVEDRPRTEIVGGLDDIREQIHLAAEGCKYRALNLHHSTTAEGLRLSQPSDIQMSANGVRHRSIISAAVLNDPGAYATLEKAHQSGEAFRTLPDVPTRMLIFDRDLAVVALDPSDIHHGAVFLRVGIVIDLLAELFERMWSTADPIFTTSDDPLAPTGRLARILELMAIGTTDERIARTIGISVRTVRREIAEVKRRLGVRSRAEIGAEAVRRGWLPRERIDET